MTVDDTSSLHLRIFSGSLIIPRSYKQQFHSMNLFPNFGQTFTIDAQIPFAQVAERREPNFIAGLAQALGHYPNERIGASRLSGFTAEVSERMQHNIAKIALISEPF